MLYIFKAGGLFDAAKLRLKNIVGEYIFYGRSKTDGPLSVKMATYCPRHSWATFVKFVGISSEVISHGLGHSSIRATEIYLKSFKSKILD